MTLREQIQIAVDHFGSQAALAEEMGCSQQQISYLLKAKSISADMAKKLHDATDGKVSKFQLRPDIFDTPRRVRAEARA
jgi:DNA-binding transcriptional regulator YdaS (Cro superfamily)